MIKFDRIKLLTKANYFYELNPDLVKINKDYETNIETFMIKQAKPYNLFIQIKPAMNEAIIEFSSKVLLDDYPKLISWETINQCLENIRDKHFCKLEINEIINDSDMMSGDITNDIDGIYLPSDFRPILMAFIRHLNKYHIQKYGNSGYTIDKEVTSGSAKLRLTIYNKHKELLKATNRKFINSLANPDLLMSYFSDKYRIETNVMTLDHLRQYCETSDTSLVNILTSKANPLLKIFDIVFVEDVQANDYPENNISSIFDYTKINQIRTALVMKECGNDLEKVLVLMKGCYSPNSNFRKIMSPYKTFIWSLPEQSQNRLMIGKIREKLIAC